MSDYPTIYLAGPMTGIPKYNFPAFDQAAADLRGVGHTVVSPHEAKLPCGCFGGPTTCGGPEHIWSDYLRNDLLLLLQQATAVALLPGWETSRGASLERDVAEKLGMDVRPVADWLQMEAAS